MASWEALPGETPIDISHLKVKGVGTRAQLNRLEAENILNPVAKYLAGRPSRRLAPFDLPWVKRLHREMFDRVWKWAGKFRCEDLNLGISWLLIEESLENLLRDRAAWAESGMDVVEQAARLHHKAVWIHPFLNGNGRWARLLANILLKQNDHPPTDWPETLIGTESTLRGAYLEAIRMADDGDYEPLTALHRTYIPAPPHPVVVRPGRRPDPARGSRPRIPPPSTGEEPTD